MKVNKETFDLLDNSELYLLSDMAKKKFVDEIKPNHMDQSTWLAQCWFEAAMSMAYSKGLITLKEQHDQ